MLNFKNGTIEEENEEILKCVDIRKLMEQKPWEFLSDLVDELEVVHKHQDITTIKKDDLLRAQGRVEGIMEVKKLFENIKEEAEKPERDPITGEEIPLGKNK